MIFILMPVHWRCVVLKVRGERSLTVSGGYSEGETPLPIPNREVKPLSADGTWLVRAWESRTPPVFLDSARLGARAAPAAAARAQRARSRRAWAAEARPRSSAQAAMRAARSAGARARAAVTGGGRRAPEPARGLGRGRARRADVHWAGARRRRGPTPSAPRMGAMSASDRWAAAPRPAAVLWRRSLARPRLEPRALIPIDLPVDLVVVLE